MTFIHKPARWLVMLSFALVSCTITENHPSKVTSPNPDLENTPSAPSVESQKLAKYYGGLQDNLLAGDLLRRDGGGLDTPYTASNLEKTSNNLPFMTNMRGARGFCAVRAKLGVSGAGQAQYALPLNLGPVSAMTNA